MSRPMPPIFTLQDGWIMRYPPDGTTPVIAGRVFGPDGAVAYQLAGRPHDHLPVYGFPTREDAFDAAERALTTATTEDIT